jgi:hypothetical protein
MALIAEDQMKAIERALREGRENKPGRIDLSMALAAPLVLVLQGAHDSWRAFGQDPKTKLFTIDVAGLLSGSVGLLVGLCAGALLIYQFTQKRKASEIQALAQEHVDTWLAALGNKLPQGTSKHA